MNDAQRQAAVEYLLSLGDDELVLAHRDSEWTGHAPILEEDIAFANIALDEMGHAVIWYRLHADLAGKDPETYPDHLVFQRTAEGFRNAPIVELPNGDWAFSMLRQFLFDAAEQVWLEGLGRSAHAPIAAAARKIMTEERYHLRHTRAWTLRLGLGTEESHARMQRALDALWPFACDLWTARPGEHELVTAGICPDGGSIWRTWEAEVVSQLEKADLARPKAVQPTGFDRTHHTPHLTESLAEMQSVARLEPEGVW
ncbi:MAG TPA: 1,2-phenylacetyl-CoA epoxidase subunit PaaC [Anaerolineales bacterium]|nr:1,2-phenylacetyl-CoA epoxidase subunit PaaC [Anaerolineales bacterium]